MDPVIRGHPYASQVDSLTPALRDHPRVAYPFDTIPKLIVRPDVKQRHVPALREHRRIARETRQFGDLALLPERVVLAGLGFVLREFLEGHLE